MLDAIAQAVLAREEVIKYLSGTYSTGGNEAARERIYGYLDELRTTQRHAIYRALQHPLGALVCHPSRSQVVHADRRGRGPDQRADGDRSPLPEGERRGEARGASSGGHQSTPL